MIDDRLIEGKHVFVVAIVRSGESRGCVPPAGTSAQHCVHLKRSAVFPVPCSRILFVYNVYINLLQHVLTLPPPRL
jgi:hypothetical protein